MSSTSEQKPNGDGGSLSPGHTREALLTGSLLIAIAALAWIGVVIQAAQMQEMSAVNMEMAMSSNVNSMLVPDPVTYLIAWGVMMAAMMLPSATPMIALYSTIQRNSSRIGRVGVSTVLFALMYLVAWLGFGIPVYIAHVVIEHVASANPATASILPYALALVLVAAGIYQFTPLKRTCLRVCQSPLRFLMGHWRDGYAGTFKMALEHAAYCVGCCWGLMVVLVAAGAMALHWVLLIAVVVFAEKLLPRGEWTSRMTGVAIILLGIFVAAQPNVVPILQGQGM